NCRLQGPRRSPCPWVLSHALWGGVQSLCSLHSSRALSPCHPGAEDWASNSKQSTGTPSGKEQEGAGLVPCPLPQVVESSSSLCPTEVAHRGPLPDVAWLTQPLPKYSDLY
ncbi:hypothetical protein H1C71_018469, partial [Ictidomys tridecemlineatus]